MVNKYYTPELEEFHVGFEYEHKECFLDGTVKTQEDFDNSKWVKQTCDSGIIYIERALNSKNAKNGLCGVRVKHLDREDIESLGFNYDKTSSDSQLKFYRDNLCLFYRPKSKELGTFTVDPEKNDYMIKYTRDNKMISALTIKNKSELKRLLKQLKLL